VFFVLGVLCFHQLAWLPAWPWFGVELALAALLWKRLHTRVLLALLVGFSWAHAYALITLPPQLPGNDKVLRLVVSGRVASLPDRSHNPSRFIFEADRIEGLGEPLHGAWRFRISWRDPPEIHAGEAWRLPVRLRAVHGYAAPGAWDYEGWLYWQGVRYKGYVVPDGQWLRLPPRPCCRLTRLRASIGDAIDSLPVSAFARGVIRAISIGDKAGLDFDTRELFRVTGTSHLMAISGLHIGLLAGLGIFTVSWLWRRVPGLCARVPARLAGTVAGLFVGTLYAALAGMGLPTQRALIMLAVFALEFLLRRRKSSPHALAAAAILVLLWHPPSIVSAGFWLSFGAVLAILAALRWSWGRSAWYQAGQVQLAISLALWPILMVFDMPVSGMAPVVNLVLVPVFGFVVVPFALLGTLVLMMDANFGARILGPLGGLLDWVRLGLDQASQLPLPDLGASGFGVPEFMVLLVVTGLILSPPGIPLRWLALVMLSIIWLPRMPHLSAGEFEVHLLDVGQGLSTLVETRHRTLIFDTGPQYASGFSTAAAVVNPFLARRGRRRIDKLVLSHGDKDHAGGVDFLLQNLDIREVQSGEPQRLGIVAGRCVAGEKWRWDGVDFEFLQPPPDSDLSGNDASCVLRVSNPAGSVLLTGDIGMRVENRLVRTVPEKLKSHAVVAPHHGSRSSSGEDFVAATDPVYVLYATGWANRYGFPADPVADRWREAGAIGLDTAVMGTISLRFLADGRILPPVGYRLENKRFWWHDSGLVEPVHAVSSGD
jgi:competence protein ComEC